MTDATAWWLTVELIGLIAFPIAFVDYFNQRCY